MSTPTEPNAPPSPDTPLWRFSLRFYARPGVGAACIELQDRAGVDVNVLLFLLWNATRGRALSLAEVTSVEQAVRPWRETAVIPLRAVRRALKREPGAGGIGAVTPQTAETFRTRIKAAELAAEQTQQETLYALAPQDVPAPGLAPIEAARASLEAYQAVVGRLPQAPLEAVLAAFADFAPP